MTVPTFGPCSRGDGNLSGSRDYSSLYCLQGGNTEVVDSRGELGEGHCICLLRSDSTSSYRELKPTPI